MKKILATLLAALLLAFPVFATTQVDTLCYKSDATGWQCGTNPDEAYSNAAGTVTYEDVGNTLHITVDLTGMKPNTVYQLTLNGRNGNDGNDELATNCDNPDGVAEGYECAFECGYWAGGTGQEGYWNFDMNATTDENGNFHKEYSLEMPVGHYGIGPEHDFGFGFIVKEFEDCQYYDPVLMEENGLDWTIISGTEVNADVNGPTTSIDVDTTELDFGTVYAGYYSPWKDLTIRNTGSTPVIVTPVMSEPGTVFDYLWFRGSPEAQIGDYSTYIEPQAWCDAGETTSYDPNDPCEIDHFSNPRDIEAQLRIPEDADIGEQSGILWFDFMPGEPE